MIRQIKNYGFIVAIAVFFFLWFELLYFIPPEKIVDYVGVENSYLFAFLLAAIAGFSSITGTSFYVVIATLAQGGSDPILLGLSGGLGLFISDSVFYAVIMKGGRTVKNERWQSILNKIELRVKKWPVWAVCIGVFIYAGFSPLPNDLMLIALAISPIPYRKFALFLLAGDLVLPTLIALGVNIF